jgi:hypothetical protein
MTRCVLRLSVLLSVVPLRASSTREENTTTPLLLLDEHHSVNKKGARCGAKEKLMIDVANE